MWQMSSRVLTTEKGLNQLQTKAKMHINVIYPILTGSGWEAGRHPWQVLSITRNFGAVV